MSKSSALLTAREMHGPYTQLLTNLQGERGDDWLIALKKMLRRENPWGPALLRHGRFSLPASLTEIQYDPKVVLESLQHIEIDESFKTIVYPMVDAFRMLGLWPVPIRYKESVFGFADLEVADVTADAFLAELRQGFGFRLDHFWFRTVVQLCNGQEMDFVGGFVIDAPNLLFIETEGGYDDERARPLLTPVIVESTSEGKWKISALEMHAVFHHAFPEKTRVITSSVW